ncbi:MAG: hypothetical protein E5W09_15080 [Mesorhizobium sp.]|nr:MAG: hypothetical protein E5W09_15080 [Mesorhizobium sp.]
MFQIKLHGISAEAPKSGGTRTALPRMTSAFEGNQGHIVIAVFDASTGERVENAKVTVTVSGLGHVG